MEAGEALGAAQRVPGHTALPTLDLLQFWAGAGVAARLHSTQKQLPSVSQGQERSPKALALPDPFPVCPRIVP